MLVGPSQKSVPVFWSSVHFIVSSIPLKSLDYSKHICSSKLASKYYLLLVFWVFLFLPMQHYQIHFTAYKLSQSTKPQIPSSYGSTGMQGAVRQQPAARVQLLKDSTHGLSAHRHAAMHPDLCQHSSLLCTGFCISSAANNTGLASKCLLFNLVEAPRSCRHHAPSCKLFLCGTPWLS